MTKLVLRAACISISLIIVIVTLLTFLLDCEAKTLVHVYYPKDFALHGDVEQNGAASLYCRKGLITLTFSRLKKNYAAVLQINTAGGEAYVDLDETDIFEVTIVNEGE